MAAPKTNDQIKRDFSAMPALSRLGLAADDIVRIAASGMTGGLVGDPELTREAKVRAGLAGDVANVAGMVGGLKGAGKVLGGARTAIRLLPTAAATARTAGPVAAARLLTGTAGPGLVPVAAPVSKAALAKGAGVLGLLGLSVAGRQEDSPAAPVAALPTAAAPAAQSPVVQSLEQGRNTDIAGDAQDQIAAAVSQVLAAPHSIRQLQAVSSVLPAALKQRQTAKDAVFGTLSGINDTLYRAQLAQADKLSGDEKDQAVLAATEAYRRNLLEGLGVDPSKQALAALLQEQQAAGE